MRVGGFVAASILSVALAASASAAERDARGSALYERWRASRAQAVDRYIGFLAARGVSEIVPMHQLLRTASAWDSAACRAVGAEPFELPPEPSWAGMVATLRLLQTLRVEGWIEPVEVVSAYRGDAVNLCADGRPASRHRLNVALDVVPVRAASLAASVASLCAFHATHGARWRMGLSVYPSGRIHIDTAGHRSWGADGTRATSACRFAGRTPP